MNKLLNILLDLYYIKKNKRMIYMFVDENLSKYNQKFFKVADSFYIGEVYKV